MIDKKFVPSDHQLWDDIRRSITPLSPSSRKEEETRRSPSIASERAFITQITALPATSAQKISPASRSPPSLQNPDRRTMQRLMRGRVTLDGRLDLHGLGLEQARIRLLGFLEQSRQQDHRLVLIITGKGASPFSSHTLHGREYFHAPERQGRLRREVPLWFHEPDFRALISTFQPAHPKHGGGGAFYVCLRKYHRQSDKDRGR